MLAAPIQTTLDQGVPLQQVTFCVVDLETTGGSPAEDRITEVGAVKYVGGERIGVFQALVNPEVPIPPYITHVTGIDDRSVVAEPPIEEILPAFLEFCRGAVFVAHNVRFDYGFIKAAFKDLGYLYQRQTLCTVQLSRNAFPGMDSYSLGKLCESLDITIHNRHRAMGDAEATAVLFTKIIEQNRNSI